LRREAVGLRLAVELRTPHRHPVQRKRANSRKTAGKTSGRRWSRRVTQQSDALDLERRVFTKPSARAMALSLKRSAERSRRRKSNAFRSSMSMLTFYVNRAGRNLPASTRRRLQGAKRELRKLFHKDVKR
jgi:hypothetical protein